MLRTLVILPDGSELSSGIGQENAIQSMTFTQSVNDGTELSLGSVCANMVQLQLITPAGGLTLNAGDEITVYKVDDTDAQHLLGLFTVEKPTRSSANTMNITAYDRVTWLDKDLSKWLAGLDGWPYSLLELSRMVCEACGLTLVNEEIPNGNHQVQKFSADGITGRQLIRWAGELAGRFCRANADGTLEFAWYEPAEVTVGGDGLYFYQGSLSFEDYETAPIEKVQLRTTETDVGAVYPDIEDGNTYIVSGNFLVDTSSAASMEELAQSIYEQLQGVQYTPCKVTIPAQLSLNAGQTVSITDANGKTVTACIMKRTMAGQRDTLECTGSHRRDTTTAVNNGTYKALSGRVLELSKNVEGLHLKNADVDGRLAALSVTVDGIGTQVEKQQSDVDSALRRVTAIEQTAEEVSIQVKSIQENGVSRVETSTGYTFGDDGLQISKSGEEMENRLDHTGMYVERSGEVILQANNQGVQAADVTVRNYLVVGDHARFENYGEGRTACFWLGG